MGDRLAGPRRREWRQIGSGFDLHDLVLVLGTNSTARALSVSPSLVSHILKGTLALTPEVGRRAGDLRFLIKRALDYFYPDEVGGWLFNPEPHLGGSAPINVLMLRGVAPVIVALEAVRSGAFA